MFNKPLVKCAHRPVVTATREVHIHTVNKNERMFVCTEVKDY